MPSESILTRIIQRKEEELQHAASTRSELEERAASFQRRPFRQALLARRPAIIAEIKKASPSRGVLVSDFDPAAIAATYEAGGASAISVLTDRDFFEGSLADLQAVRSATQLPVLRKDFTTAEYHIVEAAAHGADAILLIASVLDTHQLRHFREIARSFDMDALVEVHDEQELDSALQSGADLVGVNNRDLRTFTIHLEVSHRLAPLIPDGVVRVSESGIFTRSHIQELEEYQAFLVGESLMRSPDPVGAIRNLCS